MKEKEYLDDIGLLEVGSHKLSQHLAWLLRMAIWETTKNPDTVNVLVYRDDLPKNVWGMFHAASKAIIINLEHHFYQALGHVQEPKHMNNSLRVLLLRDILDTVCHEAWHGKACLEGSAWDDNDLDQEGAIDYAWKTSWSFGEHWDINVDHFGPVIDTLLMDIYNSFAEDVKDSDCAEWKKIQFHMLENNLNYYNPFKGLEIRSIREVFQAQVAPETPWMGVSNKLFHTFMPFVPLAERSAAITPPPSQPAAPVVPAPTAPATPVAPVTPQPAQPTQPVVSQEPPPISTGEYDPYNDCTAEIEDPFNDNTPMYETPAPPAPTAPPVMNTSTVPAAISPVAAVNPANVPIAPPIDVKRIEQILEQVLHLMFHHVYEKCEFNVEGGYNNPCAVLDPIDISGIDGAVELFTHQDTLDINGDFLSHAPVNGMIKGLPAKIEQTDGRRPRYTFYLNIGGKLEKRMFIAQNHLSTTNNGFPAPYAQKVKNGDRIMSLFADGAGGTAAMILEVGCPLGQEEFKTWNKDK